MPEKPGKLDRIKINGFKSIETLDLQLKPLNIIIGPNGSGKSNFIGFFKFVEKIVDKNLQFYVAQQLGSDKILHFGRKHTRQLSFLLESTPYFTYGCTLVPDVSGGLIFVEEFFQDRTIDIEDEYNYDQKNIIGNIFNSSIVRESVLPPQLKGTERPMYRVNEIIGLLTDWRVYHFHDTSEEARIKQLCSLKDKYILQSDAGNLAAFLYSISGTEEYRLIVKTIQRVAPFFLDFVLEPEKDNKNSIRLRWRHRATEAYFDASDLSDGTLRFICLTTLLLQPELPTIILIDEPELGLHPYALNILAAMMRTVSSKTQIIVSTQAVTFANQFSWEDIIVVDLVNNKSEFRRLNEQDVADWLEEYSVGELWEKNVIGGTP
ncbi:MAG: AAA family ATPase [Nitrospirae bacterium]|nr:AAA family ATPase [Nitrospirota bacterium]